MYVYVYAVKFMICGTYTVHMNEILFCVTLRDIGF